MSPATRRAGATRPACSTTALIGGLHLPRGNSGGQSLRELSTPQAPADMALHADAVLPGGPVGCASAHPVIVLCLERNTGCIRRAGATRRAGL